MKLKHKQKNKHNSNLNLNIILNPNNAILILITIIAMLGIYSYSIGSTWYYDDMFIIMGLIFFYRFYKSFNIKPWAVYFLLAAVSLHALGNFGFYEKTFVLGYDKYMHLVIPIAISFATYYFISYKSNYSVRKKFFINIFFVWGLANTIEIIEFFFMRLLGPGEGMLFLGKEDLLPLDTISDLVNNLLGAVIGTVIMAFNEIYRKNH